MLCIGRIVGGKGIGSERITMPPKPCEGDFLFSPLFVGRSPLQGDVPFGGSFSSAKCRDPIKRSAVSSRGSALGWWAIGSLRTSCIGTSAVTTSTHISSAGTSADVTDSRGRPRPAFSLVIAMPAILNGAIASLHDRHKKQCL
jgi:hypothetical protein